MKRECEHEKLIGFGSKVSEFTVCFRSKKNQTKFGRTYWSLKKKLKILNLNIGHRRQGVKIIQVDGVLEN